MDVSSIDLILRLGLAALAGAVIGTERELGGHPAGIRTHALVSTGAAMFTLVGLTMNASDPGVDSTRMAAQVITGLGFVGAGAIMRDGTGVRGLTTASTIWMSGALGVAFAAGEFELAFDALGLVFIVLIVVRGLRPVISRLAPDVEIDSAGHLRRTEDTHGQQSD